MTDPSSIHDAEDAIERFLRRSDALIQCSDRDGRRAARELLQTLVDADQSMGRRLEYWVRRRLGGGEMRFSEASLIAYREQVRAAITMVQDRLLGITNEQSMRAARVGLALSTNLFNDLERAFVGVVRPLPIDEAAILRLRPSLLARHMTSVDRYTNAMVTRMERIMAQGLAEGVSQYEMVQRLVGIRGPTGMVSLRAVEVQPGVVVRLQEEFIPEGLFVRHRMWPWRIVRTEVAEAQNAASDEAIAHAERTIGAPMKRKILAVMDNRTAMDSIGVHGQVRGREEYFVDGAGRRYLRPPSRPHDRETLIPWRERWSETRGTRALTESQQRSFVARHAEEKAARRRRRQRIRRLRQKQLERQIKRNQASSR